MTNQPSTDLPHAIEDQIAENLQPDSDDYVNSSYAGGHSTGPHAHYKVPQEAIDCMQRMFTVNP